MQKGFFDEKYYNAILEQPNFMLLEAAYAWKHLVCPDSKRPNQYYKGEIKARWGTIDDIGETPSDVEEQLEILLEALRTGKLNVEKTEKKHVISVHPSEGRKGQKGIKYVYRWDTIVTREDLIKYCESIGEHPVFLFPEGKEKSHKKTTTQTSEVPGKTGFLPLNKWIKNNDEIQMIKKDDSYVVVYHVKKETFELYNRKQMGFGKKSWDLLKKFLENKGIFSQKDEFIEHCSMKISRLNKYLDRFLGLPDARPIKCYVIRDCQEVEITSNFKSRKDEDIFYKSNIKMASKDEKP